MLYLVNEIFYFFLENLLAGCCKSEFDTSYPVHLHGIIHPEEYANSIRNINQAMSFKKAKIVCTVIFSVCVISAISLCVAGDLTSTQSQRTNWRVMAPIGACLFVFGIIFILISCCVIRSKRSTQIREAVAKESMKYYNRSSVPCSWRLHANQLDTSAFYSRHRSHGIYQVSYDRFCFLLFQYHQQRSRLVRHGFLG